MDKNKKYMYYEYIDNKDLTVHIFALRIIRGTLLQRESGSEKEKKRKRERERKREIRTIYRGKIQWTIQ